MDARGGMVDVPLVEDDEDDAGATGAGATGRRRPGARPSRRRTQVALVAVAVVVSAIVGGPLVGGVLQDRRDDALVAARGDLPGAVASLREPLRAAARAARNDAPMVAGGLLLTTEAVGDRPHMTAHEIASGRRAWSVPSVFGQPPRCVAPGEVALACHDQGTGLLVAVERTTGEPSPRGEVAAFQAVDDDVVLLADSPPEVARVVWETGEDVWRVGFGRPDGWVRLSVRDGFVAVEGAVGAVLDASDGTLLGTWEPARAGQEVTVVTGPTGFGVWTERRDGVWHDREGRPGALLPGRPVLTAVSDGSAPEVVLTYDAGLRAVDVRSGEILWQRPPSVPADHTSVPVRLDGHVVLPEPGLLTSVDVRSGASAWVRELGPGTQMLFAAPVTDGVRLALGTQDRDGGGAVVVAVDLSDGGVVWQIPAPIGTGAFLRELNGHPVLLDGESMVVLG